uniref:Beta/gamma crystallin 'Greek key' domain-containing protein n=1 Tax=Astyanax mexicanus TaxID=7994 RepID=A0A8B9JQE7_ASTMX
LSTVAEESDTEIPVESSSESDSEMTGGRRRWEEPVTPAGEGGITNTGSDSHAQQTEQSDSYFSGVFKATRVELPSSPTDALPDLDPDTSMPASPHDMDTLLDTLKSMGPPVRHRTLRNSSSQPFSSLPPIVEDAPSPSSVPLSSPTSPEPKPLSSLPPDLGLNWSSMKDMRSPLTMMKEQQASELSSRSLILPSRASTISSIVMRKSSLPDLTSEDGSLTNGGGSLLGPSRLDHSLIFSSYRSEHDGSQGSQDGKALGSRSLFRTASLPEVSSSLDRLSMPPKSIEQLGSGTSRFDRLSFLTSPPGSLTGLNEMSSRMSVSPSFLQNNATVESPTFNHTPPSSLELFRTLSPESPVKHQPPPSLQRSLSSEGHSAGSPVFNGAMRGFGAPQEQAPERNFVAKYRAFPDAYLTKEKEHGKLNPRPGKMFIFNRPGLRGQRTEIRGDVMDATAWQFPESISIRVVRGGWVLYEKPDFKGEKIALDEGDIELTYPWSPAEDQHGPTQNGTQGSEEESSEPKPPARRQFIIGSLRRAVRVRPSHLVGVFPDVELFGFRPATRSIHVLSGAWVAYSHVDYSGHQFVLEKGFYNNCADWGSEDNRICSIQPILQAPAYGPKIQNELLLFSEPGFQGKCRAFTQSHDSLPESLPVQSCRVVVNVLYLTLYGQTCLDTSPVDILYTICLYYIKFICLCVFLQKRKLFRIRYKETGHYMSVQGGVDTMKSGRVVVSEQVEGMSDIWFYQDGLLKNKLAPTMSLQVMGSVESGSKVVLWSETRTPVQRWSAQLSGAISSLTFPGLVLDVKGEIRLSV